jgi:hypothetical protein
MKFNIIFIFILMLLLNCNSKKQTMLVEPFFSISKYTPEIIIMPVTDLINGNISISKRFLVSNYENNEINKKILTDLVCNIRDTLSIKFKQLSIEFYKKNKIVNNERVIISSHNYDDISAEEHRLTDFTFYNNQKTGFTHFNVNLDGEEVSEKFNCLSCDTTRLIPY